MLTTVRRAVASLSGFGHAGGQWIVRVTRPVQRHRGVRRLARAVVVLALTLVGVLGGVLLAGPSTSDVGPFQAQFALTPAWSGGTDLQIPPLGAMEFASHHGPIHLTVRLGSLDQNRTLALATSPDGLAEASRTAVEDVRDGIIRLAIRAAIAGLLGALLVGAFVLRSVRRVAIVAGLDVIPLT